MADRPVRFELHVVPLIRAIDRDRMLFRFDLLSYDDFKNNVDLILGRTPSDMPPTAFGGPWPKEWVAVVQRWKDEGCLRLDLATPDANGYRVVRSGDHITVTCRGTVPTSGYHVWLDTEIVDFFTPRTVVLYAEPPVTAQPAVPTPFRASLNFILPTGMTDLKVRDASGVQTLAIPSLPPTPPPALIARASLPDATTALTNLGATLTEETPTTNGRMQTYAYKGKTFELFHDGHTVEVDLSPHAQPGDAKDIERTLRSLKVNPHPRGD